MQESTTILKSGGQNIDEFVKRSNNLKIIQKYLPKYKMMFNDVQHVRNIILDNKFEMKKEDLASIIETQND